MVFALLAASALLLADPPADVREVKLPFNRPVLEEGDRLAGVLSADGRRLVVSGWTKPADEAPGEPRTRLAVVDLAAGTVVTTRDVVGRLERVAADAHHVYAGLGGADGLLVLAADTLAEKARLATPKVVGLIPGAGRVTVALANRSRVVLAVPDLSALDPPPQPDGDNPADRLRGLLQVGVADEGGPPAKFYDRELTAQDALPDQPPLAGPWGVRIEVNGLTAASGRLVGQRGQPTGQPDGASILPGKSRSLTDRPLLATPWQVQWFTDAARQEVASRVVVVYQSLATGRVVAQVVTPTRLTATVRGQRPGMSPPALFAGAGDTVAVLAAERLYLLPPPVAPGPLPEPLRAVPRMPGLVAPGGPARAVMPEMRGGKPPYRHTLRGPIPGVSLDPAGGGLTIDPGQLAVWLTSDLTQTLVPGGGVFPNSAGTPAEYAGRAPTRVERLTGRKPTGVPVWVVVRAEVRDALLETVMVTGGFVFDLPAADLQAAVEAETKRLTAARAAEAKAMQARSDAGELDALRARVQALEARLDELNRKLDAVLKALEAQKPKDK